jgi:hypothetical protein
MSGQSSGLANVGFWHQTALCGADYRRDRIEADIKISASRGCCFVLLAYRPSVV